MLSMIYFLKIWGVNYMLVSPTKPIYLPSPYCPLALGEGQPSKSPLHSQESRLKDFRRSSPMGLDDFVIYRLYVWDEHVALVPKTLKVGYWENHIKLTIGVALLWATIFSWLERNSTMGKTLVLQVAHPIIINIEPMTTQMIRRDTTATYIELLHTSEHLIHPT